MVMKEIHKQTVSYVQQKEDEIDKKIEDEEREIKDLKKRKRLREMAEKGNRHMFEMIRQERQYT